MMLQNLRETCAQLNHLETIQSKYLCPNCKKALTETAWNYTCTECNFKLPKKMLNVAITDDIIKILYSGKKTKNMLFTKKDGSTFSAGLCLGKEGIEFDFTSGIPCPFCKKDVQLNQHGCFCDCGLKIYRNIAGKKLTDNDIEILLTKGKTAIKKNFKKKNGDTFDAGLQLTKEKKVNFYF